MKKARKIEWVLAALLITGWAGCLRAAGPASPAAEPVALTALRQRAGERGYRVREIRWDPVLRRRWAVLESVAHPERPVIAELTELEGNAPSTAAAAAAPAAAVPAFRPVEFAVRLGDKVVLWSAEQNVRMQMGAVAEGNAAIGDRIELRVTGAGVNGDAGWRVSGIVRGPGSVEMEL